MLTPDIFVEQQLLQHGTATYDPVKAREYYLRNRQLKGRRPGTALDYLKTRPGAAAAPVRRRPAAVRKPVANPKALKAKIGQITGKLSKMKQLLDELVEKQKAEQAKKADKDKKAKDKAGSTSGGDSKTESSDAKEQKLTPAQKAEKAKKARETYEKNKETNPKKDNLSGTELAAKITEIRSVIRKAESELANAKKALQGS